MHVDDDADGDVMRRNPEGCDSLARQLLLPLLACKRLSVKSESESAEMMRYGVMRYDGIVTNNSVLCKLQIVLPLITRSYPPLLDHHRDHMVLRPGVRPGRGVADQVTC